jgi:hypothetical protein
MMSISVPLLLIILVGKSTACQCKYLETLPLIYRNRRDDMIPRQDTILSD